MEGIPLTPEDDDSKESKSKSKKKSAEAIGAFIVEPKAETKPQKIESFWQKLTGQEIAKPVTNEIADDDAEADSEPLGELSPIESQVVERALVQAAAETVNHEPDAESESAVTAFREKIISENVTSDVALTETLDAIEAGELIDVVSQNPENTSQTPVEAAPLDFTERPIEINRPIVPDGEIITDDDAPVFLRTAFMAPLAPPSAEYTAPRAQSEVQTVVERDPASLLVGGIVGYLIGRRRGRIRTERRLLPIQEQLQKQVETMQQNLLAKEAVIRRAVSEKQQSGAQYESQTVGISSTEQLQRTQQTAIERQPTEIQLPRSETALVEPAAVHVESLSRHDLLELADKIVIDGTSLRRSFENNVITEKALRRIIGEHLRGGDIKKVFKREIVEHQIDFERDPIVRDKSRHDQTAHASQNSSMVVDAEADTARQQAELQRATREAQAKHDGFVKSQKQNRQRILDITMVLVITILLLLIIGLVINRH